MKICAAQVRPVKGDIAKNIVHHREFIDLAIAAGAGSIFFPELSLTGYEPELVKELAIHKDDKKVSIFQEIANEHSILIGVGMPTVEGPMSAISMLVFQPHQPMLTYSKSFLHEDELDFFTPGNDAGMVIGDTGIAPAICYEIMVPEHAIQAAASGASIYAAGVVKSKKSIENALNRMSLIAKTYSMPAIMANSIGITGGYDCPGKSSAWNSKGLLVGQLNDRQQGILVFDIASDKAVAYYQ